MRHILLLLNLSVVLVFAQPDIEQRPRQGHGFCGVAAGVAATITEAETGVSAARRSPGLHRPLRWIPAAGRL